jgi:hypothetical protein
MSKGLDQIGWVIIDFCAKRKMLFWREYPFHPERKWRFDFAIPEKKIAIEYQGGIFMAKSGHSSIKGQSRDQEKMNQAQILGWKVLSYNALNYSQITDDLKKLV